MPGRKDDIVKHLETVELFRELSRAQLAKIAKVTDVRAVRQGEVLVREGTYRSGSGPAFFLIGEGTADVSVKRRKIATLKAGSTFGEMSLLDGQPRSATVTARTPMVLYRILSWHFLKLVKSEPTVALNLLKVVAQRLREADKKRL